VQSAANLQQILLLVVPRASTTGSSTSLLTGEL